MELPTYNYGSIDIGCISNTNITQHIYDTRRNDMYFPHHLTSFIQAIQYQSIYIFTQQWNTQCDTIIEEPVLLVTRYEYANLYHMLTAYYNTYQAKQLYYPDASNVRVILLD